ncbi:MAG: class I SAM-dependent methyltransferase, partial [Ilumatobacteraceae bacterium]
ERRSLWESGPMTPIRSATDVLASTIDLDGLDVLDIGCGAGELVRWMRGQGARTVGAECGEVMRGRAIEADPDHAGDYVDAVGQDLPFDDASFDLVVFSYSLHHVPKESIFDALREARRVLRPDGMLYVVEPDVEPAATATASPVVDESVVRTAAQRALDDAESLGFRWVERDDYLSESVSPDFESWERNIVGIDPERHAAMDEHREHLRQKFERDGERREDGWAFRHTNRRAVLRAADRPCS